MIGSLGLIYTPNTPSLSGENIFNASLALSIATNGITTMIIAYKLWYVSMNGYWIKRPIMKLYQRSYRTFTVKTLGLSGRKTPVQTVLILLVESGLVYLAFQVSQSLLYCAYMRTQDLRVLIVRQITYYVLCNHNLGTTKFSASLAFQAIYYSLIVSVRQPRDSII